MEAILGVPMREPINLKNFLENYQAVFNTPLSDSSSAYTIPVTDFNLQEAMKLSDDESFHTIEENCFLDLLQSSNDPFIADYIPGCTEYPRNPKYPEDNNVTLKTVSELIKFKNNTQRNPFQRSVDVYTMVKLPNLSEEEKQLDYKPGKELKIYVRVYRPARATHQGRTLEKPVFAEEFECLGSNYLTELRDKIHCVCNNNRFFDISEAPESSLPSKETDPGYFFITDTFYNDKRNALNPDYSKRIIGWAKKAVGLENIQFKTASMERTRFIDLTVSLGFPQHYQHHGNCEHVFVFSQLEIITTPFTQALPRSHYPRLKSYNHFNNRTCNTCGVLSYVYVVKDCNRQVYDPAYLCKKCFLSYHYVDGKKVGDFKAYRLFDDNKKDQKLEDDENCSNEDADYTNTNVDDASNEEEDEASSKISDSLDDNIDHELNELLNDII